MRFWQTRLGAAIGVLLLCWAVAVAVAGTRVYLVTHPPRQVDSIDFESMRMPAEEVRFRAVDGPWLTGWLIESERSLPTLLLCHDLGSSKTALVDLAFELHSQGFPVLLFDFRAHGESAGDASTLGLTEKRDILGALDFLAARNGPAPQQIGIYGVGMGAHAAVLAAADRRSIRVLVLDGVYPDVGYRLARRVFADWKPAMRHFQFLPRSLFSLMSQSRIDEHRAGQAMSSLLGRDVLLLAPAGDARLVREMHRMYAEIPNQPDVDPNLVVLPATQSEGLYGKDLVHHREQVVEFFVNRLGR